MELKYFSSAIDTWKTIFHYLFTTDTNVEPPEMVRAVFFIGTIAIFMYE